MNRAEPRPNTRNESTTENAVSEGMKALAHALHDNLSISYHHLHHPRDYEGVTVVHGLFAIADALGEVAEAIRNKDTRTDHPLMGETFAPVAEALSDIAEAIGRRKA